jgi:hypothetical protein
MSDQRIEQVDPVETGSKQLYVPQMQKLLLDESMIGTTGRNSCVSKETMRSKRRNRKRRKECYLGILIIALSILSQVIDGLSLIRDIPTDGRRRLYRRQGSAGRHTNIFTIMMTSDGNNSEERDSDSNDGDENESKAERNLIRRVTQLEELVAKQEVEIQRLKRTCHGFSESMEAFTQVIQILRDAGRLQPDPSDSESTNQEELPEGEKRSTVANAGVKKVVESFDDAVIFGTAPTSVIDAADGAGAAILAAMLGGKQRMLIDVRDAELSTDSETLVQFIELAVLPIAAGLEGLKSTRNRLKVVFPKVSQLLEYRRTMALVAPEVVALSTLGFDPVEKRDKLVVLIAPAPDDGEGLAAMREMLAPSDPQKAIQQPIVVLNHHMVPIANLPGDFEKVYHLRLLSVQYISGGNANEYFQSFQGGDQPSEENDADQLHYDIDNEQIEPIVDEGGDDESTQFDDEALEAAMKHAHEVGTNQGFTRAMVIRAYPR